MSIATPTIQPVIVPQYRLRWRFDFAGKPPKIGIWNGNGNASDMAWLISKEGLVRAAIEGEDIYTYEALVLLEIDGQDYSSAEWDAYSKLPGFWKGNIGIKPRTFIAGLSFLTRTHRISVGVDGSVTPRPLNDDEQTFSKKEHSV